MRDLLLWLSRKTNYPFLPPQVMQISLTYRCNLRCKMCNIFGLLPQEEELTTAQVFHAIDEARAYNIREVLLTGGEPLVREDLGAICRHCAEQGLRSIITTNGALIDARMAQEISAWGVSHIHVSLDGLEATNDFFRGNNAFKKAVEGIVILNNKRKNARFFSLGIACTVMDNNVQELSELLKMADSLGVDVINFQPLVSDNANFLDKKLPSFWVRQEKIPLLEEEIKKMQHYQPLHITVYEEPRLELLVDYYQRRLSPKDWVCFGGFKTVFICYDKRKPLIYSCHGICGDLEEVTLKKAWLSKDARKLRLHSGACRELCMQGCYSQESAQSLKRILFRGKRKK